MGSGARNLLNGSYREKPHMHSEIDFVVNSSVPKSCEFRVDHKTVHKNHSISDVVATDADNVSCFSSRILTMSIC